MRIQHNIMAMNAYRNYTNNVSAMKKNLEKLSSGYRINRAGDDAAGLAISEKMRAQISGLETAQKNAKDGISLVQTAEGALTEVHDMLNRMVELATQSANGTYEDGTDRIQLQKELDQLLAEIDRIADSANFNGIKLLDGSMSTQFGGAISNIVTSAFQRATSAGNPFSMQFIRERPDAAGIWATKASFELNLDDFDLRAIGQAASQVKLDFTIGDAKFTIILPTVGTQGLTAASLASLVVNAIKSGNNKQITGNDNFFTGSGVKGLNELSKGDSMKAGSYVKMNGNIWTISASNGKIKFEQADAKYMGPEDDPVIPDGLKFSIAFNPETPWVAAKGTPVYLAENINIYGQNTRYFDPKGANARQAQAEMTIDFSMLRNGDTIKVGSTTYTIWLDASTAAGSNNIFLKGLDLNDTEGQRLALSKIVAAMASNSLFTAGNESVAYGKGRIFFQSRSSNTSVKLTNEEQVLDQFRFKSGEVAAKVSFDVDPAKVKKGDTFTINGVTYEFTDSSKVSNSGNIAVNLNGLYDDDGVNMTAAELAKAMASAIKTDTYSDGTTQKYTVTTDGKTITLVANDDPSTSDVKESRNSIKVTASGGKGLQLQIGDTSESWNQLTVNINDCHAVALGVGGLNIGDQQSAQQSITVIKDAINYVSDVRGSLGATQNRLDHTINNLSVMTENIQDAESTIRDVDIAEEMMAYTKNNILIQSAQAMLAQANQVPQGVLQLLQ